MIEVVNQFLIATLLGITIVLTVAVLITLVFLRKLIKELIETRKTIETFTKQLMSQPKLGQAIQMEPQIKNIEAGEPKPEEYSWIYRLGDKEKEARRK